MPPMKHPIDDLIAASSSTSNSVKPVFLTKAQREQLSLQRRQDKIAEQKRRQEDLLLPSRSDTNNKPSDPGFDSCHHRSSYDLDHDRDRDRDREKEQDRDSERRKHDREREEEAKARERAQLEKLAEREREKELEAIKQQYLGTRKPKKRVIKPSEKFRFSFDWENTEDTSRDMNSLYQNPHEARLLFGRGFCAGMDRREQKKLVAKNEKETRDEIQKDGVEEKPEEVEARVMY